MKASEAMTRLSRRLLAILLLSTLAVPPGGPARADDGWNPFTSQPETSRPPKKKAVPEAPDQPYLPPMNGSRGDTVPPGTPYGTPYGSPDRAASDSPYGGSPPPPTYGSPRADADRATPPRATAPVAERDRVVDRGDLAPIMAPDGSGLPFELWQGIDLASFEQLVARLEIPPRSPALHNLWKRLITSDATPPTGAQGNPKFDALRAEVLFRSGLLKEMAAALAKVPNAATDPVMAPIAARAEIALGNKDKGCAIAKSFGSAKPETPKPLRAEALMMLGYCVAANGNAAGAGLAADVARDEKLQAHANLALLDAVAAGARPALPKGKALGIVDYRLLELVAATDDPHIVEHAGPALLAMIALGEATPPDARLAAAEAAVRVNALTPEQLAEVYRAAPGGSATPEALLSAQVPKHEGPQHRAALYKAAEAERTPMKKVRLIRAFLDDARRALIYLPALQVMAKSAEALQPVPEIGWFAETAIEISLAAGQYDRARTWARFGAGLDRPGGGIAGPALDHWLALADVADATLPPKERGAALGAVEALALSGRFNADQLNRIATVLDALDYNVPMRLWEAASKGPQPSSGHLPATGVLAQLQEASKKKEFGRTVLLAMDALGPNGAEGAHMIALGDAIRGLRRAGLDPDARRLGFEALFGGWPRSAGN